MVFICKDMSFFGSQQLMTEKKKREKEFAKDQGWYIRRFGGRRERGWGINILQSQRYKRANLKVKENVILFLMNNFSL